MKEDDPKSRAETTLFLLVSVDGKISSSESEAELMGIKALQLTKCEALKESYVRLEYDVIQDTIIDSK